MSDKQISTEATTAQKTVETVEDKKPAPAEKKPRQRRQRNDQQKRRGSSASDGKNDQKRKARNSPREGQPDTNMVLVARKPIGAYVAVLKTLLATKYEECELQGVMPQTGNSKVIWIANRMVEWGYCAMTRVRTVAPAQLCITLRKTADFDKVNEQFNAARAEKLELRRREREEKAKEREMAAKVSETD